jgi:hypothetical protein
VQKPFLICAAHVACYSSFEFGVVKDDSQETGGARETAGASTSSTAGAAAAAPGPSLLQELLERDINNLASSPSSGISPVAPSISPFSMISPIDKVDAGKVSSRAGGTDVSATPGVASPSPSDFAAAARTSDSMPSQVRSPKTLKKTIKS